jgi:hypothetical protein
VFGYSQKISENISEKKKDIVKKGKVKQVNVVKVQNDHPINELKV